MSNNRCYILLTNALGGLGGGQFYVRNKVLWLQEHGWDVFVYESSEGGRDVSVVIPELQQWTDNNIPALFYPPSYHNHQIQEKVIKQVMGCVSKKYDTIVVESNTIPLSLWGEIVASRLFARHIVFLIGECVKISTEGIYEFYKYKHKRDELFSINAQAYKNLFQDFCEIQDSDVRFFYAGCHNEVVDIRNEQLDKLPDADYTIGHFGRYKPYYSEMLKQINAFALNNGNKSINLVMLGVDAKRLQQEAVLDCVTASNVSFCFLGACDKIPKSFFEKCDVVIASAGCAVISSEHINAVVTMDVAECKPLGIYRYTTLDRTYKSQDAIGDSRNLEELLYDVLISKEYLKKEMLISPNLKVFGPEYQENIALSKEHTLEYFNTHSLSNAIGLKPMIIKLLVHIGLYSLINVCR